MVPRKLKGFLSIIAVGYIIFCLVYQGVIKKTQHALEVYLFETIEMERKDAIEHKWSAKSLIKNNQTTMLSFPMEEWPSFSPSNRGPCPFNISFSIPDLPEDITTDVESFVKGLIQDEKPLRTEVAIEWALLQLFRTSSCRTYNSNEADLHIIPYMHTADCHYHYNPKNAEPNCGQVTKNRAKMIRSSVPKEIPLERQIFLSMTNEEGTQERFRFKHKEFDHDFGIKAKITTGNRQHNGVFAMPFIAMTPKFQPSIISNFDEAWWTRPRKYAFVAIYGGLNTYFRPQYKQPRCFRIHFFDQLKHNYPNEADFAGTGLPYHAQMEDTEKILAMSTESKFKYDEGILCPILAGDSPFSARFFDVILKGCIPVVMEYELFDTDMFHKEQVGEKKKTWWVPEKIRLCRELVPDEKLPLPWFCFPSNVVETYPFISHLSTYNNTNNPRNYDWSIDYRSFVVTAEGNTGENQSNMTALFEAMESVLKDPVELRRRQLNMMKYATQLTLGVGLDAHKYDDAFSGMLKLLELYKDGL